MNRLRLVCFLTLLLILTTAPHVHAQSGYIRSPYLGITFISSAEQPANETRYRNALLLGAGWNRYPFYWDHVEATAGNYDWHALDRVVTDDIRHGLQTNAILLGVPGHARQGALMRGLYQPIFSDGSDYPGAGKTPNPANPWAQYVFAAVQRYKPGGVLASQPNWELVGGVSVWEVWNEPDLPMFWGGTPQDYARLLRVSYVMIKHADPFATVMFGGLSFAQANTAFWLRQVLDTIGQDPSRGSNNWYFDQIAMHSYSSARRTVTLIGQVRFELSRYSLERPIWLNESGVPVWDDYPGPTWTALLPSERRWRGTQAEQAIYVIQNTTLAWAAGVDAVFFHQLYDDCGNQAGGTDFPPNDGSLCTAGQACWGDAHGLYRNERSSVCFRQHPQPGTPRIAASAFYLLAQIFGSRPFVALDPIYLENNATVLIFEQANNGVGQRIYVVWNDTADRTAVMLPASSTNAMLYRIGDQQAITPLEGLYRVALDGATRGELVSLTTPDNALGGEPVILVEAYNGLPADTTRVMLEGGSPRAPLTTTPGAISVIEAATITPAPTARPTTDPALDTQAPLPYVDPLPDSSPASFTVRWGATDNSGVTEYLVWVRVDGGEWQPWQQTTSLEATYTGSSGSRVEFAAWAVDLAGNWSANTELAPQAATTIQ